MPSFACLGVARSVTSHLPVLTPVEARGAAWGGGECVRLFVCLCCEGVWVSVSCCVISAKVFGCLFRVVL